MRPIENSYIVPGTRLIAGEYPGSPPTGSASELSAKLERFVDAGVDAFVDLTSPADGLAPYQGALQALAKQRGLNIAYERRTIRDMDICRPEEMKTILDAMDRYLSAGRTVYVHCWGGVGRTGTVIGCWLVRHGKVGQDALNEVGRLFQTMSESKRRRHPAGAPETKAQRAMVLNWAERSASTAEVKPPPHNAKHESTPGESALTHFRVARF